MTAINANMNSSIDWLPLSEADAISIEPGFYTLDSENLEVGGPHHSIPARVETPLNGRWLKRAAAGSSAASHTSGATLTRYYPDAPGGTGGGGVTVDNGVDTPASVTTLSASSAVVTGDTANLFGGALELDLDSVVLQGNNPVRVTVDANEILSLTPEGRFNVSNNGAAAGGLFVTVADDRTTGWFKVEDASGDAGFYILGHAKVQIIPQSGATGHMLEVWDPGANNRIFTVDADGSVHIKTGTSIVADL